MSDQQKTSIVGYPDSYKYQSLMGGGDKKPADLLSQSSQLIPSSPTLSELIMSHGKQFTLYTHDSGPNGWYTCSCLPQRHGYLRTKPLFRKATILLEELGLTYEPVYLDFGKGEHKAPDYLKINPNGRIPAIIDHQNNDFIVW